VRLEDESEMLAAQLGFPDPHDCIAASPEICVARSVAPLLCCLAVGQRLISRVSMPIIAVRLQD